jgi:tetratricopeptide (TPR) repeat protein
VHRLLSTVKLRLQHARVIRIHQRFLTKVKSISELWIPKTNQKVRSLSTTVEPISTVAPAPSGASPWIYRPWLDLTVGCGAWSAPLLALALFMPATHSHAWAMTFYLFAIVFNYPHFMATIYRAYHTRENFDKYKFVTLHVTLLILATGILMHASPRLFPWVFTLYIYWSPWHYSGQNYGLLMMFAKRSGAVVTPTERKWLRGAFVASYCMLLGSFVTGGSTDPLILSPGIPAKFTLPVRVVLALAFALCTVMGFRRIIREHGARAMLAPLTLAFTQFLWFVLPTLLELNSASQVPQTRYSSGILAVLHSTQYIWITSYFQRREAIASGKSNWSIATYFVTLFAGGIALFIPGPWLVSFLFHYDFTTSFLIFMSLVNIHHFILDSRLWKLRDSRVSSLLVESGHKPAEPESAIHAKAAHPTTQPRASLSRILMRPAFQIFVAGLLFLWGGFDQIHFAMRTDERNLPALLRAASINPYDSSVQARIATAASLAGNKDEAAAALVRAVEINPASVGLQHACARALIEDGRYADAYAHYRKMLTIFPRDSDALVNYGLLAARLGHPEEAIDSWEKATEVNPQDARGHLYLAGAYDEKGEAASAARHWNAFITFETAHPDDSTVPREQVTLATIHLADDEARLNHSAAARTQYEFAIAVAQKSAGLKIESLALAHLADLQEKVQDAPGAAQSYQRALALDAKAGDPQTEGLDWFNYGQFLRRHAIPDDLVYACLLQAEELLEPSGGANFATVQTMTRQVENKMSKAAAEKTRSDRGTLLAHSAALPSTSF